MSARRWHGPPLQVIGLGLSEGATLGPAARAALEQAELVIGGRRHLDALPWLSCTTAVYPSPFGELWTLLERWHDRRVALLASGDPLFFGIGSHLRRFLAPEQLVFHPHVSSVQAAFARIGQPWQDAEVVSVHGRPLATLRAHLGGNRWYALLTDAASHPAAIAAELVAAGFADSNLWVAEDLGTPDEHVSRHHAAALAQSGRTFSPLNVVIVHTRGPGGVLPEFPGIPDERFSTGAEPGRGLLSKREVRLAVLSLLQPRAGEVGWDVGAGCGGVAVEWARWNRLGTVHAVEHHAERLSHLAANRERFGAVHNLEIHSGRAPEALATLPDPDAVFVGGGGPELPAILGVCWQRLRAGGRLVAAAVTEDSKMALYRFADTLPLGAADWVQITVSRGEMLAGQRLLRPQLPVLLMAVEKSW
ncbi:MAG TPA: precorrin-6y C5,15-methyltransferase (decarboxylating) subunit CbiE [Candidatus Competibacteraceae bacterium]|nr:precorrin-6y C5,15-methyltransferase (decarboxylating) subunit CbiE [Candidatus Competibacteraceae bacterium]